LEILEGLLAALPDKLKVHVIEHPDYAYVEYKCLEFLENATEQEKRAYDDFVDRMDRLRSDYVYKHETRDFSMEHARRKHDNSNLRVKMHEKNLSRLVQKVSKTGKS
jgi:hypothetical protein